MPFIISGVGMGLFFAPVANVVLSAVRPHEEGQASGANNAIREVGGVFGVAVLASVFSAFGGYTSPQAFTDGMKPAILIGAAFVAVGSVASFAIPKLRRMADPGAGTRGVAHRRRRAGAGPRLTFRVGQVPTTLSHPSWPGGMSAGPFAYTDARVPRPICRSRASARRPIAVRGRGGGDGSLAPRLWRPR